MTVITKPITEKKTDKLEQPLVAAECLPNQDAEAGKLGGEPATSRNLQYLVMQARARHTTNVTSACVLLTVLLVMCCGMLVGFALYKQMAHAQMRSRLRGWCKVPYEDANFYSVGGFQSLQDSKADHFINEEFDIDGDDTDSYEKITVPNLDGRRSSRFIHDFNANKTGIIDVEGHRCFVMPLNRSRVLPPQDLIDLVRKMWEGYYDVDTDVVRETMRVVLPPVKEPHTVGVYIERECGGYPIYKLEKIVSGVFKRSTVAEPVTYTHFSGKYLQLSIANEEELEQYEREHSHT